MLLQDIDRFLTNLQDEAMRAASLVHLVEKWYDEVNSVYVYIVL